MTDHYEPPASRLEGIAPPAGIIARIKSGYLAACLVGGLMLLITLYSMVVGETGVGIFGISYLASSILMLALAFGIHKRSLVAAVAAFVFFLGMQAYNVYSNGNVNGLLLPLVVLYFLGKGVLGTYQYKQYVAEIGNH